MNQEMRGEKKTLDFGDYKKCLFDAKGKGIHRSQLISKDKDHETIQLKLTRLP